VAAVVAIGVAWCPTSTLAAAAHKRGQYGVLTLSGPIHARFVLSGQCIGFKLPALAASPAARTLGISVLMAPDGAHHTFLFTVIDEDVKAGDTARANLATTESFNAQFAVYDNSDRDTSDLWEGGWWRVQAPGEHFAHYGTGKLTVSATGSSGHISGTLTQVNGRKRNRLTVRGSWSCRKLTQAA
jgi:hypothetical protein